MTKETLKSNSNNDAQLESCAKELSSVFAFIGRMEECATIAGSPSALAKAAGLSQSGIRRYFDGGEPTRPVLILIANAVGVNLEWLALGTGPKFQSEKIKEAENTGNSEAVTPSPSPESDNYCYIPLYDVYASAGHGALIDQEHIIDRLAFKKDWLKGEMGLSPENCCLIHVSGDSMEPTLHKKDVVMLDRSHTIYIEDGIYCLRLDDGLMIKRLQRVTGRKIDVISDNPAYRTITIDDNDTSGHQIIGRVVWAGKRF